MTEGFIANRSPINRSIAAPMYFTKGSVLIDSMMDAVARKQIRITITSLIIIPKAVDIPAFLPNCIAFFKRVKNTGPNKNAVPNPSSNPFKIGTDKLKPKKLTVR